MDTIISTISRLPVSLGDRFQETYNLLNLCNLDQLDELYTHDVEFEDPFHRLEGLDSLKRYFEHLYRGVADCRFEFSGRLESEQQIALAWKMHLRLTRRPKDLITVNGSSFLTVRDGKISRHRDYFDAGELVYERVPLLGAVIRRIKKLMQEQPS